MICSLNILFNHPVSEATPNSKITGAYWRYSQSCWYFPPFVNKRPYFFSPVHLPPHFPEVVRQKGRSIIAGG
jgi:hypothetical protein